MEVDELLKKLSSPARRAVEALKMKKVEDLSKYSREGIAELHGIGPSALKIIEAEMARLKIGFKDKDREGGSIDDYIRGFPKEVQAVLEEMRRVIKKSAPAAKETISYRMPAFEQNGILVYFAAFKNHIGFYPTSSPIAAFKDELSPYVNAKGSVRFPLGEPLPTDLIGRMVKFRAEENAEKHREKGRTAGKGRTGKGRAG